MIADAAIPTVAATQHSSFPWVFQQLEAFGTSRSKSNDQNSN